MLIVINHLFDNSVHQFILKLQQNSQNKNALPVHTICLKEVGKIRSNQEAFGQKRELLLKKNGDPFLRIKKTFI